MRSESPAFRLPLFAFILAFGLCRSGAAPAPAFPKVAPAFWNLKLKTLDGDSLPAASLRGGYVLLNFWGEWCPKCREELPFLKRQHAKYAARGLRIVGLLKSVNAVAARKMIAENGAAWTQCELDSATEAIFGIEKFPTNILISPEGEIVMQGFSGHFQEYKRRMDALGGGSEIGKNAIATPAK